MVLLLVVVLVVEGGFAVLPLRPEVSSGDENTGTDEESCAEVAKGHDEGNS